MSVAGSRSGSSRVSLRPDAFVYNSHSLSRSIAGSRPISRSPGSKLGKSQHKRAPGDDDENISINSDASSARQDLMTLGIDLDEGLIQRMKSLGINKVFQAANKNVDLVKSRQNITPGAAPEIVFRHNDDITENTKETESTMRPWEPFAVDIQRLSLILREIHNSQGGLDPSIRSSIDAMIQHFRLQYSRDNGRFVRCMLGLPSKQSSKVEPEDIQRLILKTRFVDEIKFAEMIGRIHISASPNQISSLFSILSENKVFGREKVLIVDLWLFLSLLRTASEESRRSYDCKTTKLAADVEFWEKSNNKDSKKDDTGTRKTSKNVLYHEKHRYTKGGDCNDLMKCRGGERGGDKESDFSSYQDNGPQSIAKLLGSKDYGKPANVVAGKYFAEGINESDVAMALNPDLSGTVFRCRNTYKNKTSHPRTKMTEEYATNSGERGSHSPDFAAKKHHRYDRSQQSEHCWSSVFGQPDRLYVMDGISLSALFSQQQNNAISASASTPTPSFSTAKGDNVSSTKPNPSTSHFDKLIEHIPGSKAAALNFKMSSHILEREMVNKSSVADALCYDTSRVMAGIAANPGARVNPQLLSLNTSGEKIPVGRVHAAAVSSSSVVPDKVDTGRYANRPKDSISNVINYAL